MKPITFSLQFRGQVTRLPGGLRMEASAPGCALLTSLTADGPRGYFVSAPGEAEALFESTLAFKECGGFAEEGTILFAPGNRVRIRGRGELGPSADPELRQGTVVWKVVGGEGRFDGSSGLITSNFLLSDNGDLTENQLGVIFPTTEEQ